MSEKSDAGFMATIQDLVGRARTANTNSVIAASRYLNVSPICIVDADIAYSPSISDIVSSALNQFIAFYSLAVSASDLRVRNILEPLSPSRDVAGNLMAAMESFDLTEGLPRLQGDIISMEGVRDATPLVAQAASLSVGKLVEVGIPVTTNEKGTATVTASVNFRLATRILPVKAVVSNLGGSKIDTSLSAAYADWKYNVRSLADVLFGFDIMREAREKAMSDKDGVFDEIQARASAAEASKALSLYKDASAGKVSNVLIISSDTAKEIERTAHGRFTNYNWRTKIMGGSYAMILMIVDPKWNRVKIYYDTIAEPTEVRVKDMAAMNAKSGSGDLGQVLRDLRGITGNTF